MSGMNRISGRWSLTTKLVLLFVLFGFIPMAIVELIAYKASLTIEDTAGTRFQNVAEGVADKIDRNLFERYGDVQAFGINRVIDQKSSWYRTEEQNNPTVEVMNQYVDTYDLYYLTILVDLEGRVIAVNSKDADGKPIQSHALYRNNYRETTWFRALKAQQFTNTMPFAAAGNQTMSGTYIEDLHLDSDVKAAYPGDDGLTLGFSAPVYREGKVVAYWTNRAKFSLVEDILRTTQQELKVVGFPRASIVLLDKDGTILADYDPAEAGAEQIRHDFTTLMTVNLAGRGLPAAKDAVAGKAGFATGPHYRSGVLRMSGYTHLKGALGYPGMNWSILVSVNHAGATADAYAINRNVLIAILVCLAVIVPTGIVIGRVGVRNVNRIRGAATRLAGGALDARVPVTTSDEIGQLAQAFNTMGEQIQTSSIEQQQRGAVSTALEKVQAVIEFNLDGTVITANQNFLSTVGYSLDEIKGHHHRMFCETAYTNGGEYQAFWAKLNRGEFDAGSYKRIGKGGKEIWIQASYSPIMDANGKPYKVVKFATDITGQKQAQNEVEKLIKAAAAGQLAERIKTDQFEGASKALTQSFNQLLDAVATPLHEAQGVLTALAANDLTQAMSGAYQGEFEQMKTSLNAALTNLSTTVSTVRGAVEAVTAGSEQITKGSEDLSQRTSEQASALEETSASMEEMTSTVKQNADNAKQANQLAIAARDIANKGGAITTKAVEAMGEINKSSKKIADIITVIDEIAFQTNLLALNAAVEAARAGEHGRGFAVVAAEVRNLAQRSATAAKEIKGLINESIQRVTDGSELVDQSGKTLQEIVGSVKRVTDIIAEITAASQEQASGIEQVNKAIMQMDETTQQNAALVEETTSASQSMKDQARELMRQVEAFKINQTDGHHTGQTLVNHTTQSRVAKLTPKKAASAAKPAEAKNPVAVGVSNGKDHQHKESEFEEF